MVQIYVILFRSTQTMDPSEFYGWNKFDTRVCLNTKKKDPNLPLEIQSNIDVYDPKEIFKCLRKTFNPETKWFKTDSTSMADIVRKKAYTKNKLW